MTALFIRLVEMSLAASIVALAVMILKLPLKKAPRWIHCLMWVLVAVRLILPVTFESRFSLMPELYRAKYSTNLEENEQDTIPDSVISDVQGSKGGVSELPDTPDDSVPEQLPNDSVNDPANVNDPTNTVENVTQDEPKTENQPFAPDDSIKVQNTSPKLSFAEIASVVWLIGTVIMVLYGIGSWVVFNRKVAASIHFTDKIYVCDYIDSPFILGVIRPRIYIPSSLDENKRDLVIAHEMAHIKRGDHIYKPLGFLLLSLHWFNPIVWISYALLCRDIEIACDERAIKDMDPSKKKEYVKVLLDCSISRKKISACPLAFGEVSVKDRIKNVLNYKKPTLFILIAAIVVIIVLSVVLLTDPKKDGGDTVVPSETESPETDVPETDVPETDMPETDMPESEHAETDNYESSLESLKDELEDIKDDYESLTETEVPETDIPETDVPETDAPETDAPETDAPETDVPETDAPETDAPETDAPETEAPETDAPETEAPKTDAAKEALANFGYYTHTASNGLTIPYRMYVPKDYTWRNDYPVLMIFHSKDYCGTDNEKQMTEVEKFFGSDDSPALDCIVIVPQISGSGDSFIIADPSFLHASPSRGWSEEGIDAVVEILEHVNDTYSTDLERQYFTGFGEGGAAVWNMICRHHEKISAAVICSSLGGLILQSKFNESNPIVTKINVFYKDENTNRLALSDDSLCISSAVVDIPLYYLFEESYSGSAYMKIVEAILPVKKGKFNFKEFSNKTKEELGATYISKEDGYKYLNWLLEQRRETK